MGCAFERHHHAAALRGPDHPLIEAKLELVEAPGGNPFSEYALPEAILKLRQGVGA